jgi:ribosomal protein L37AE/L43A
MIYKKNPACPACGYEKFNRRVLRDGKTIKTCGRCGMHFKGDTR